MAGDEGFEPPIVEPESTALPLGQSPVSALFYPKVGFELLIRDSSHLWRPRNYIFQNKF